MSPSSPATRPDLKNGFAPALAAVLFLSTSPVLIRWAAPLSAYEITTGRLLIAALCVGALAMFQKESLKIQKTDRFRFGIFGLITALHFLSYIASLQFTTIAHSLTLVYTAPVFIAVFSAVYLKESIPTQKWAGIALVIAGIAVLAGFEPQFSTRMLAGDILALISALTFGLYSVAGRSQRANYPLLSYAFWVYLLAAGWMLPVAVANFTPAGYGARQVFSLAALGIVPLGLGHTLYNAALRRMNATYVNLIASQEVTGGILLGMLFLGEMPGPGVATGVIITLVGIAAILI